MRQIFESLPWVHPAVPAPIVDLYRRRGTVLKVKKNEVLKAGGENPKCFYLVKGLCVYRVASEIKGTPSILSLITPGRSMCDISASVNELVNVETTAWQDSTVIALPPTALSDEASQNPGFGRHLLRDVIAKQESHIEGMVANFTLEPQARLKTLLRVLIMSYGIPLTTEWLVVPLLLNNSQYGQIVNLSRISVSRILSQWMEKGLAMKSGRSIKVRKELFSDIYDWVESRTGKPQTEFPGYGRIL